MVQKAFFLCVVRYREDALSAGVVGVGVAWGVVVRCWDGVGIWVEGGQCGWWWGGGESRL